MIPNCYCFSLIFLIFNIVTAKNSLGSTPLHFAAYFNRPKFFETLVEHGADVNSFDKIGRSPLTILRQKQNSNSRIVDPDVVSNRDRKGTTHVTHEASPAAKNKNEKTENVTGEVVFKRTPFKSSMDSQDTVETNAVTEDSGMVNTFLSLAKSVKLAAFPSTKVPYFSSTKSVIESPITSTKLSGEDLLLIIKKFSDILMVEQCLKDGADVNHRDDDRNGAVTALHLAAERGRSDVCKVLLEYGADVEVSSLFYRFHYFESDSFSFFFPLSFLSLKKY